MSFDETVPPRDARLLDELGAALGPDASPPGLVERAAGLLAYAEIDRELAELLDASAAEPAGMRGAATGAQPLMFEVTDGSVALEVTLAGDRLDGQVLSGAPVEVALQHVTGPVRTCPVDELGRFSFDRPAAGPSRLRLHYGPSREGPSREGPSREGPSREGPARPVTTDWFLI